MQLVSLSNKIKPITLTISIGLLSTTSAFSYSDIDAFTGIPSVTSNNVTTEYMKTVDKSDIGHLLQKFKFHDHLLKWERSTFLNSSVKAIIENSDFQAIVSMKHSAVPLIIEEIEKKPSLLVWALNMIYERKITNDSNATITEACKLWVKELKK
ncbi:hypothetical protein DSECCO2_314530 [anaerobic digester metagenome]|nr:hypothetical protein [Lentimicrobium sp.]